MYKEENNSYVYLHRRLDTNEIFYIGIGAKKEFKRAYEKGKRNRYWRNITNKCEYSVEIIHSNISWTQACIYETELIKTYGRIDLNSGILVNMTFGGEGAKGRVSSEHTKRKLSAARMGFQPTIETRKKMSIFRTGTKQSPETILKRSISMTGKPRSISSIKTQSDAQKKLIINLVTGIFYLGIQEAADSINIKKGTLNSWLKGYSYNKSSLIYC